MIKDAKEAYRKLFYPHTVAVVGASEKVDKLGYHCMKSLVTRGFRGRIYPINPKAVEVFGLKAYASISEVPEMVDLVIVAVSASIVPSIIDQCKQKGVGGIAMITAGFKEIEDPEGEKLQEEVAKVATEAGIRVIGPNTFGFLNLHWNLNASFTPELSNVPKGGISLVSQSGGICHLMIPLLARSEKAIGFAKVIGLGNRANTDFSDILAYLSEDPETQLIMIFIEGTERARDMHRTLMSLRGVKPVVAYKAGRSEIADMASRSHTGSLSGSYGIYRSAFRQAGVIWSWSTEGLIDISKALLMLPIPKGKRIGILSAQAGPGIVATDACSKMGLEIASFSERTEGRIKEILPPLSHRGNPVDLGPAWYDWEACRDVIEAVVEDPNVDAMMIFAAYASANEPLLGHLVEVLKYVREDKGKPLVTCFPSPPGIWEEEKAAIENRKIPVFPTPERAIQALAGLVELGINIAG